MSSVIALAVSLVLSAVAPAPAPHRAAIAIEHDFETPADSNATWPAGWRRGGNRPTATIRLDAPAHGGERALRMSMPDAAGMLAVARDAPDSLRAGTIAARLSGWLRTENAGSAGLWLRVAGRLVAPVTDDTSARLPRGTHDWTHIEVLVPVAPEMQLVSYGVRLSGGGTVWADDLLLELLQPGEQPPSSPAALRYFDAAIDSVCRRTVVTSDLRWGMLKSAARNQLIAARTPAQTHDALLYAIHRLDGSGELLTAAEAAARRAAPADAIAPSCDRVDDAFGRVAVAACMTRSVAGQAAFGLALHGAIAAMDSSGARGWVVDLRGAGIGEIEPLLAGLAPLLGEGVVAGSMRPDGTRTWWTADHGRLERHAARGLPVKLYTAVAADSLPVAVLTDAKTAREGEAAVLAFRGRPHARVFGEPTQGNALEREIVRLADGVEMRFSTARFTDRTGHLVDGPLQPDERVSAAPAAAGARDSVTLAALRWLHAEVLARP